MRKINRNREPEFWIQYKHLHPGEQYADLRKSKDGSIIRREIRRYLLQSQCGLCAYCCRKIEIDGSLNEHIKPQASYPKQSMNYDNLIVSCKTEGVDATCGARKGNKFEEGLFVSPLQEDCEEKFVFYPNGQIEGVDEAGEYTSQVLNLNAYELQRARRAQYKVCASYHDAGIVQSCFLVPTEDGQMEPFADMVQYFYERGHFAIERSG